MAGRNQPGPPVSCEVNGSTLKSGYLLAMMSSRRSLTITPFATGLRDMLGLSAVLGYRQETSV